MGANYPFTNYELGHEDQPESLAPTTNQITQLPLQNSERSTAPWVLASHENPKTFLIGMCESSLAPSGGGRSRVLSQTRVGEHESEGGDEGVLVRSPPAMEMRSGSGSGSGSASTSTSPTTEPTLSGSASVSVSLGLGYHLAPLAKMNTTTTMVPAPAAGYMADPQENVSFNGAMSVEGLSSSGASPVHGHGHGHEHAITGSPAIKMTTTTLIAAPPLALLPTDLPTECIDHTQPLPPPTLTQTTTLQLTLPPTTTLPPAQSTAQSDPELEVKDYGYGYGAASGSGYIDALAEEMLRRQRVWNVEKPERAREREAEWRLQQQQHMGRGFGGGSGGGRGLGPSERGGYGGPGGYVLDEGPRGARMPPPFEVMLPPPPHFQALIPGERKGRYWGIPGSSLQGQVEVQDSGVDRYYNPPPPRQEQLHQQQLGGLFERSHGGFDERYGVGVGPQQSARNSIPNSQAQAHGIVGGIGGVGVPVPLSTPLDTMRYYLLSQLEYYLSPQNMARDFNLRKQVCILLLFFFFSCFFFVFFAFLPSECSVTDLSPPKTQQMDTRGWIPIPLIASRNRVRQITADVLTDHVQLVREVLTLSSVVQVSGGMVRMNGWESFVLPGAPVSEVEGEVESGLGIRRQQQGQEEQQQHQC